MKLISRISILLTDRLFISKEQSIREYQKGYDALYVNWEQVLSKIEDNPTANKYVFNY